MTDSVTYAATDGVALITMDDGKANVMSREMLAGLSDAYRRAESEGAVVVLTGRAGLFSAGYDMGLFDGSIEEIVATLQAGGELIAQMLAHPLPTVAACNGHAIAQGAFTLLACDVRVGVRDGAKIGLNEVAIGLTIPHYGVETARHQLAPAWFDHATLTGTLYEPAAAQQAGFLHETVDHADVLATATERAKGLLALDMNAHAGTKERVRRPALDAIRHALAHEFDLSGS